MLTTLRQKNLNPFDSDTRGVNVSHLIMLTEDLPSDRTEV